MPRRAARIAAALLLIAGCVAPEREAALRPLPEGQPFRYLDLLARARSQATTALEAFYVDNWIDVADAAAALEQTSRFLPKTNEIPASLKDRLAAECEQLHKDAVKLGDAARAKDVRAVNEAIQRITLRIRDLRPSETIPAPVPPPADKPAP
jgi:hypothetical protein